VQNLKFAPVVQLQPAGQSAATSQRREHNDEPRQMDDWQFAGPLHAWPRSVKPTWPHAAFVDGTLPVVERPPCMQTWKPSPFFSHFQWSGQWLAVVQRFVHRNDGLTP